MTKEEIKQKFFDVISAKLNYSMKIDEMKDLAEAFKTVCELDEKYCDVIIQRWENLTGGKAVCLSEK